MPAVAQKLDKAPERGFDVASFVNVSKTVPKEKPIEEALLKTAPKEEPKPEEKPKEEVKTEAPKVEASTSEPPKHGDKSPEALAKELRDQAKANLKLGRENAELRRLVEDLGKRSERIESKLDGTYNPVEELKNAPSPEQQARHAEIMGRLKASYAAATDKYGKDEVDSKVFAENAPYQELEKQHPWTSARVMGADSPVLEALQVLAEEDFFKTYGRDPKQIREKVKAEVLPELRKELLTELKNKPGHQVQGLGDVRTGSEGKPAEKPAEVDFTKLFPNLTRSL